MKTKDEIQEEALVAVLPHKRAGAVITMGGGKTLFGLRHADKHYTDFFRALVVSSTIPGLESWKEDAKKFNLEHLIPHLTFTVYISLDKYDPADFDIVYLDECQSLIEESHDPWLSRFEGKIVGMTGTKPDKRSSKTRMINKYCPIVYEYLTDEAIEDKVLNDYRIIVHMLSLSPLKDLKMTSKLGKVWFTSEVKSYEFWSDKIDNAEGVVAERKARIMRMKAMMNFPTKEKYTKELANTISSKCIIFANTHQQAERLCQHSYHSKNKNSKANLEAFKRGDISLLSSVLQLKESINIPFLREGIIMHAYGNEIKSAQRIGRLLRLNPNDVATAHILCFRNTIDETWVKDALQNFDQDKISYKET